MPTSGHTFSNPKAWLDSVSRLHTWLNPKYETLSRYYFWVVAVGIKQRQSPFRGKEEHTSLSASTYKRLSSLLLKCYLINVLVTLNIFTAGGTFVIVEVAGRVGHRWELLLHTGVDIWAAGRTRQARVWLITPRAYILTTEKLNSCATLECNELQEKLHR